MYQRVYVFIFFVKSCQLFPHPWRLHWFTNLPTPPGYMCLQIVINWLKLLQVLWRRSIVFLLWLLLIYGWGYVVSLVTYSFQSPHGRKHLIKVIDNLNWLLPWSKRRSRGLWKSGHFYLFLSPFLRLNGYEAGKGYEICLESCASHPLLFGEETVFSVWILSVQVGVGDEEMALCFFHAGLIRLSFNRWFCVLNTAA